MRSVHWTDSLGLVGNLSVSFQLRLPYMSLSKDDVEDTHFLASDMPLAPNVNIATVLRRLNSPKC